MKTKTKDHNKSYTILIVEDSPTQALQVKRILEEEGFTTAVCRNGKEALSYLKEQKPTIIISDIVMPGMDGYELCSTIKKDETLKDIAVILLTVLSSPEDIIKGLQSGADNFITKPYKKELLLSRIQYILANQEVRKKGTIEVSLNIYFMGRNYAITSNSMQIINLLLSTYEHAVLQKQELKRTHTELETLNKQLEDKVKQRTQRIEWLNSVLQSVRGINQLIVREKDPDRLIQSACEILVAARDCHKAWIALIDESGEFVTTAESGLGKEFLALQRLLKRGKLVNCAQRALKKSGVILIQDPSTACAECPLAKEAHARGSMAVGLEHGGKTFGLLSISIPKELMRDKEGLSLFEEAANDIAFGLHNMELEKERKRAEQTLHAIFQSARDGILMADAESGRFVVANGAICQMLGYSAEEIKGLSVADIHPTESLEYVRVQFDKQVRGEITLALDIPVKRKDGSVFPTDVNSAPLELEGRRYLVGIFRDITERKQGEEALREQTYELNERVKELDCLYNIARLIEKPDISLDEILQSALNLIPSAFQYPEIACARIILEGKEFRTKNFRETTWNLTRDIRTHGESIGTLAVSYLEQRPEKDEGPFVKEECNVLTAAAERLGHVIERMRTREERQKLEAQLQQSQKLEAIGTLAGGIAHDFNNILTVIIGNAELLSLSLGEDNPLQGRVEEISKGGKHAASLTHQLLAFSRKQILQPQVLDLNGIIPNMEKMLRRLIGEDIDLKTILAPDLGSVEADPGQIEQVIMNLVVNARDAMPTGGKLTIETTNVDLDETYASKHVAVKPGPYVMMAISDNGTGIDEETRSNIFEPFFTTKRKGSGTGLGLSTVYGIVKQSKGNIWVYSEPEKGTTFKIYLPRLEKVAESSKKVKATAESLTGSETIMVVEDNETVRDMARSVLQRYGYSILDVPDGEEAIRVSEQYEGHIHLMVTDVVMPGISGRMLAEKLADKRPKMKVLYMSGYTDDTIFHHGVLAKEIFFLQKPFTPKNLARKAREVLDS